jgi:hypothetical protein
MLVVKEGGLTGRFWSQSRFWDQVSVVVCRRALTMMVVLVSVRVVEWDRVLCDLRTRLLRNRVAGVLQRRHG